jgi:hypothetical protein
MTKRAVSALLLLLPAAAVVATGLGALEIRSHLILSLSPSLPTGRAVPLFQLVAESSLAGSH